MKCFLWSCWLIRANHFFLEKNNIFPLSLYVSYFVKFSFILLFFGYCISWIWKWIQIVGEVKTGDICGEIGVLCRRQQLFTVRTKRLCQLLRLNRTKFMTLIQTHVGDGTVIMNNLIQVWTDKFIFLQNPCRIYNQRYVFFTVWYCREQHLKDMKDPTMDGVLIQTEHMLAQGRMDLPLSLGFATSREDDLLLRELLKRGLDPNEADNSGRTALVCTNLPSLAFSMFLFFQTKDYSCSLLCSTLLFST